MEQFEFIPPDDPAFVGMNAELAWLDTHLLDAARRDGRSLVIVGMGGVGKTALVSHWLSSRRYDRIPLWVDLYSTPNPSIAIDAFRTYLHAQRRGEFIVILDGSEGLSDEEYQRAIGTIFNFKAVRSLIFTTRRAPRIPQAETLSIGPLAQADAAELLKALSPGDLTPELITQITDAAKGHPLVIRLLADVLRREGAAALRELIQGRIYDLSRTIAVPSTEIVAAAAPRIITAASALIDALKKQPAEIHALSPRKFEELLADLLSDMGWEVELTQQTRDGGKDILAYLNTDLGRFLCLVEAKHYRRDRKVGVELVRTLYGTLFDAQANSAMLVTSSSFSSDAREFQRKHRYQLSLRDYADIVSWIKKYGTIQNGT